MSHQTTVVNANSHAEQQIVDGDVIPVPQKIVITNCPDAHIGPKYVHINNITINNGVPHVGYKDTYDDEVLGNSLCSVIYKCLKIPYGVHLKILLCGSSFLLTIVIIVIVTLFMRHTGTTRRGLQLQENSEDYPLDKRFVTREAWGAAPPCVELDNNTLPVARVIFIHTVSSGTCNNFAACKQQVLNIQDMHMDECKKGSGIDDIGYNFVIGSDGHIFVGRGWDKVGAHTRGSNKGSIGVVFVGDFRRDEPSPAMLMSAKTLLEVGVERSKLSKDYQLFGHCQVHNGFPVSPGVNMLRKMALWPHWNDTNANQCSNFIPSDIAS